MVAFIMAVIEASITEGIHFKVNFMGIHSKINPKLVIP